MTSRFNTWTTASHWPDGCSMTSTTRSLVRVTPGIAEVEVCDEAGTCTRQAFGVSGENTLSLSFSVVLPSNAASASLDVRGFKADGTEMVSGQVVAKSKKSDCGCWKSVEVFVAPDGVETVGS